MLTTIELLDKAKDIHACSDYRLAKLLDVSASAITNYRSGRSHPDERVSKGLAELTGFDPAEVVIWMQADRARDSESRALWVSIAARLERLPASAVALLLALFVSFGGGPDAGAMASTSQQALTSHAAPRHCAIVHCILCQLTKARQFLAGFLAFFEASTLPRFA